METFSQTNVTCSLEVGMRSVAVHNETSVKLQYGSIVAGDCKFPKSSFRYINIAVKNETEVIGVFSSFY